MEHVAAAELLGELVGIEVTLVDVVARPIVENALVDLVASDAGLHGRVDHDELRSDTARLREETFAVLVAQVAVEVAGEHAVKARVGEGKSERVRVQKGRVRAAL